MIFDIGQPNKKQRLFLKARAKYIAYGGARGGGKSWVVRKKAPLLCLRYPGIKVLIVRKTYEELQQNHINYLLADLAGIAKYNEQKKVFKFANGSTIKFGYCDKEKDVNRYQGAEFDIIFIDEACLLSENQITVFNACLRGVNEFPKRVYYTLNPGGQSHGYFKRLFIDKKYKSDENPEDYCFIQSLVTDNVALMRAQPDYLKQLMALPSKLRKAWLEGRWDIFEGMFFEDFRTEIDAIAAEKAGFTVEQALEHRRFTHVIEPFEPPKDWTYYRSYDFGYGKPFSFGWWAVDYSGVAYRIAEYYGCNGTPNEGLKINPDKQFSNAARLEREHPFLKDRIFHGVADPSIWDGSRGESIIEVAERYGLDFEKGNNARIPGWMQMHYRFAFDEHGKSMIYIFNTCKDTIRTLPLLLYSETIPEDLNTDQEDHIADDIRYFCMNRPIKPVSKTESKTAVFDPLDLLIKESKKWA